MCSPLPGRAGPGRAGPGRRYYTALPDENRRLRGELRLRDGAYRALGDAVADATSPPAAAACGPGHEPGPQGPVGGPAWWGGAGWEALVPVSRTDLTW